MTAIRFEILNEHGCVEVPDGMASALPSSTAADSARNILVGAPKGWSVRLWRDVDLVGPLDGLGEPDAVEVAS